VILLGKGTAKLQKKWVQKLIECVNSCSLVLFWFGQDLEPSLMKRFGIFDIPDVCELAKTDDIKTTYEIGKKIGNFAYQNFFSLVFASVLDVHSEKFNSLIT